MPKKVFSKIFTMIKGVFVPLLRLKVSPPAVIPQSYCDVHLLRSPWVTIGGFEIFGSEIVWV